jgi:hypothetical protein
MDTLLSVICYPLPWSGRTYEVFTMSTSYQQSVNTSMSTSNNAPPPYTTYPTRNQVRSPSIDRVFSIYGINMTYRLNIPTPYGIKTIHCIYQQKQLEIYSKDQPPALLGLIKFRELETDIILTGIGPWLIHTWIPQTLNQRLIIAKLIRSVLPKLFGFSLPTSVYKVLTEQEYISNPDYHDYPCQQT